MQRSRAHMLQGRAKRRLGCRHKIPGIARARRVPQIAHFGKIGETGVPPNFDTTRETRMIP